ncbi:MAG TPA: MBOAT family protein [Candidatus Acidoferrales bacterium]|nr:MBOAT family protein [Candidatus Acidoferrales bacterium]
MTVLYLLALAVMGFGLKLVAMLLPAPTPADRRHVFWLLLSPTTLRRLRPVAAFLPLLSRTAALGGALVLSYWIYWQLVQIAHMPEIFQSYCALPILLLVSETLVAFMTLVWLPSGQLFPAIHNRPWRARSVADFWSNRWNLWVSDWFRYAIFQRLRSRPVFALVLAFAISGLLHEWVINVPLYFVTGRVLFGSMMVYFLVQAAGILFERRFLRGHARAMAVFTWLVVLAPAPLVLNEGMLRTLHLWRQ